MRSPFLLAASILLHPLAASAQSADTVQKTLTEESQKMQAWGTDATLLDAVKKQNAAKTPLAEVQRIDREWIAGGAKAVADRVTSGKCADHLRSLVAQHPGYGESFVMDAQGAIVCATERTSDYWQGDEAKWSRAYADGKGAVFIDRPRLDESAQARLAQISIPVMLDGKAVGAITVGMNVDQLRK